MNEGRDRFIRAELERFVTGHPQNKLSEYEGMTIYDVPLVGYACAQDALFEELKKPEVVGKHHLLPSEWLRDAKIVISYFLPFSLEIRKSNQEPGLPSNQWVQARREGESFNNLMRTYLLELVERLGAKAIAPVLHGAYLSQNLSSNWSERHVAYIAGLGTFGLSKSLITPSGCAGRYGSVVTSLEIDPTTRPYSHLYQYCPFIIDGGCGLCIQRCPSGAITTQGKDKQVCHQYQAQKFGSQHGCGKCQVGVPCEKSIGG